MNYTASNGQIQRFSSFEEFLDLFDKQVKTAEGFNVRCPSHDDGKPSLTVSKKGDKIVLKCHAGCEVESILSTLGLTFQALFLSDSKPTKEDVVDLNNLAIQKRIPPTFLEKVGVSQHNPYSFKIKYFQEDGTEGRSRIRRGISAGKSYWGDKGPEIIPYGLWRLDDGRAMEELFLVEGESDCWTLWAHYDTFPALGIPGNTMTHTLKSEHLDEIKTLFIVKENDSGGGATFVENVKKRLVEIGYEGEAKVLVLPSRYKDPNDLHRKNPEGFRATFMESMEKSVPANEWKKPKTSYKLKFDISSVLRTKEIPDANWIVPGLLPEGLAILGGRPKKGKSFLALAVALAVAQGGMVLGKYRVQKSSVLYVSLEDNERRLRDRIQLLQGPEESFPDNLYYCLELPRLDQGGLLQIEEFLDGHPDVKFVIVDTLGRVMPQPKTAGSDQFQEVYDFMGKVQKWTLSRRISLMLIHHIKKATTGNIFDDFVGSSAYVAAPDALWALGASNRGKGYATFSTTGKDVGENEFCLSFERGIWSLEGEGPEVNLPPLQRDIFDCLAVSKKANGTGLAPAEIAEALDKAQSTIRTTLKRMQDAGIVSQETYGRYTI